MRGAVRRSPDPRSEFINFFWDFAMKPTTKIRFTEPQIALVMRAHPHCNLDRLSEVSFEFDQAGKIVDCSGTVKDGGNIDHDYAGSGLARLYEAASRQWAARQTSATILQFPNGQPFSVRSGSSSGDVG
jgi:hypothetical protein